MERKIGEIFEYNGEWCQCIRNITCINCGFNNKGCLADRHITGDCSGRLDGASVIFKKLEKVGEPYDFQKRTFQTYKLYTIPFLSEDVELVAIPSKDNNTIEIEIKEDMGKYRRHGAKKDIPDKEKPNLKPFNLEQAKAGKPVCTRDGRKARIICFDANIMPGNKNILALIRKNDGSEYIEYYTSNGKFSDSKDDINDLMMLSEKREGWVNVDKRSNGEVIISKPYPTRDEAIHNSSELTIDTVILSWNE